MELTTKVTKRLTCNSDGRCEPHLVARRDAGSPSTARAGEAPDLDHEQLDGRDLSDHRPALWRAGRRGCGEVTPIRRRGRGAEAGISPARQVVR